MTIKDQMQQAMREPLAHFLIIGLAIFLAYGAFSSRVDAGDRRIVVDENKVARLASQWAQTWQRAPNAQELDGLIRDYIKDEVYYREALRLGLDKDDPVVRRQMRSKMEFLAASETENITPSDDDLQGWLDANPARYAEDPSYSFDQIFVRTEGDDKKAMARAQDLLRALQVGAKADLSGDTLSLPRRIESAPTMEIERQFGSDFSAAIKTLPIGRWGGPVASGFGLHLVKVSAVNSGQKVSLADVRKAVENDWREANRKDRESKAYQALLDGYDIAIEKPE